MSHGPSMANVCFPDVSMRLMHLCGSPSHPLRQLLVPIGELGSFSSFGVFLTSLCSCSYFRINLSALRVPDASTWFLDSCGSAARGSGLLPGESNFEQRFWGFLMCSDLFSSLCESFTRLCACVHAFHASVWFSSLSDSLMHDTAPLAGKSGVADEFATVHESFVMLCTCTHLTRPFVFPPFLAHSRAVLRLW